jgi:hypothetical protein
LLSGEKRPAKYPEFPNLVAFFWCMNPDIHLAGHNSSQVSGMPGWMFWSSGDSSWHTSGLIYARNPSDALSMPNVK